MSPRDDFERSYISPLNEQQREAVYATEGAVLLLAVPGSGKTTVLVTRLGYMVYCRGVAPENVLTMTYTVAATGDMKRRFASLFGSEYASRLEFRTINGVSSKIIRYYGRYYNRRTFSLLDDNNELNQIVRGIYQDINGEYAEISAVKDIRTAIAFVKNMMLTDEEVSRMDFGIRNFPEIYRRYQAELERRRRMDYDDQIRYAKMILETCPPILEYFQERYRYFCVDEAQDTSKIQHAIIRLLARRYGNLFMVGDDDQSVYGFRAAWPDALMSFERDYPGARVLFMERNYRSTAEIVGAANAFVSGNRFRREKMIAPTRGSGVPVQIVSAASRKAQYSYLLHIARECAEETAALYRNNDSAIPLIDLLERNGVPYSIRKFEDTFFSNRVVCDIVNIIRFADNPADEEIFMGVYYKFGAPISKTAAQEACRRSRVSGKPILEELLNVPGAGGRVRDTAMNLMQTLPLISGGGAAEALRNVWITLRYGQYVKKARLDANKYDILTILAEGERDANGLLRRLDELQTLIQNRQNNANAQFILSTIHSAKGLEYDCVYLLDVFDGILPSIAVNGIETSEKRALYEEERRLFYVAMTRAKNALYLFTCDRKSAFVRETRAFLLNAATDADRTLFLRREKLPGQNCEDNNGGGGVIIAQCGDRVLVEYGDGLSRILTEKEAIPATRFESPAAISTLSARKARTPEPPLTANELFCGMNVAHKSFGKGKIVAFNSQILEVQFPERNETKRFVIDFTLQNRLLRAL